MKFASWNLNSIRARYDRLLALLERHAPDVIGLQETKVLPEAFPEQELRHAGYRSAFIGQKGYNGVALLARTEPTDVTSGFDDGGDDSEPRLIAASVSDIRFICVYVPNGQRVGSEKYAYKLEWLARLRRYLDKECDPTRPLVLFGDFNIAPADADVHDPGAWRGEILCSKPERAALRELLDWGLSDGLRALDRERIVYTWWDYRRLGFQKNRGLRIDHLLVTRPVLERLGEVTVDRDERKGKLPSDHAPILGVLDV